MKRLEWNCDNTMGATGLKICRGVGERGRNSAEPVDVIMTQNCLQQHANEKNSGKLIFISCSRSLFSP